MANHKSQIAKKFKGHRCPGALVLRCSAPNRVRGIGFTLVEMITVLAIMTIIMAFAVPMFSRFTAGTRLGTASRDISTALRTARSYAITQRNNHAVNFNLGPDDGLYWIYYDGNTNNVVDKIFSLPKTIGIAEGTVSNIVTSAGSVAVEFKPTGGCMQNETLWLWDTKGRTNQVIIINTTGRVRIEKK